jgi:hypothetical protein
MHAGISKLSLEGGVSSLLKGRASPKRGNSKRVNTEQFKKFSPEPAGQNQANLVHIIHWRKEFKFVQIKGQVFFKREIITKM